MNADERRLLAEKQIAQLLIGANKQLKAAYDLASFYSRLEPVRVCLANALTCLGSAMHLAGKANEKVNHG